MNDEVQRLGERVRVGLEEGNFNEISCLFGVNLEAGDDEEDEDE